MGKTNDWIFKEELARGHTFAEVVFGYDVELYESLIDLRLIPLRIKQKDNDKNQHQMKRFLKHRGKHAERPRIEGKKR